MPTHLSSSDYISISMGLGQIFTSIILAKWAIKTQTPKSPESKKTSPSSHLFSRNLLKTWPLWIPISMSIGMLIYIRVSSEALTKATVIRAVLLGFVICTGFLFSIFMAIISTTTETMSNLAALQTEAVQQTTAGFRIIHRHLASRPYKKSKKYKRANPE